MSFVIKVRGVPNRLMLADYFCEEHGRFELEVWRDDQGAAPAEVACPHQLAEGELPMPTPYTCGKPAVYCISAPAARVKKFEAVKGKWEKPERKTYLDTRELGEGMPLHEFREKRKAIWEEKRKQDVMRFIKEG